MSIRDLREEIGRLPEQPGVYLYYNRNGETIYVGRARALRDRVRSYLGAYGTSPKTDALLSEVARLEVIVTDSLVEALALENNLIKQRAPRFNILLRDDKNYPYLQVTTAERFPRVLVARQVARDGNYYAGPFLPATFARRTMSLTHRLFGIRSCNEVITGNRGRPCLEYDIKRCIAPCVAEICSETEYSEAVEHTRLFLEGRTEEVTAGLERRMRTASREERYEQAAHYRDAMRTVETLRDRKQKMATTELGDRDAFGVRSGPAGAVIQVFQVRRGRVVERVELVADSGEAAEDSEADLVQAAVQQFYGARDAPPEVHLPVEIGEREAVEHWLSARAGRRVRLAVPRRGDKRALLDLAGRNAALTYDSRFGEDARAQRAALEELQRVLELGALPRRVECFDISTIQGSETVASMVVCEDGRMQPGEYRKFRVRGLDGRSGGTGRQTRRRGRRRAAEYRKFRVRGLDGRSGGTGRQTRRRGRRRAAESSATSRPTRGQPRGAVSGRLRPGGAKQEEEIFTRRASEPIRLDGRNAALRLVQRMRDEAHRFAVTFHRRARTMRDLHSELDLSAAYDAFEQLGLANLVAVGIAKQEEEIFTRRASEPIRLDGRNAALRLVQRMRDEAHRFAVTFHRRARTMRDLHSELDLVPGIGPRRRNTLLRRFGSLANVRRATREELQPILGLKLTDAVLRHFTALAVRPRR